MRNYIKILLRLDSINYFYTKIVFKLNPLLNSTEIFWLRTDKEGNIIRANRAWREHWPLINHAPSIVSRDQHDLIPTLDSCDLAAPPLNLVLTVKHNGVDYRSQWYISSPDHIEVDVVGMLCKITPIKDQRRIDSLLFSLNHIIMQPICHVKGLVQLLIKAPEMSDQIIPRLEQACDKIETVVRQADQAD